MSFGKYGRFGFFMIFPESHPSTLAHQKKQIQQILPILCQSWALKSPHTTGERVPTFHHWSHRNQLKSSQIGINRSLHNGNWIGIRSDIKQILNKRAGSLYDFIPKKVLSVYPFTSANHSRFSRITLHWVQLCTLDMFVGFVNFAHFAPQFHAIQLIS